MNCGMMNAAFENTYEISSSGSLPGIDHDKLTAGQVLKCFHPEVGECQGGGKSRQAASGEFAVAHLGAELEETQHKRCDTDQEKHVRLDRSTPEQMDSFLDQINWMLCSAHGASLNRNDPS